MRNVVLLGHAYWTSLQGVNQRDQSRVMEMGAMEQEIAFR